MAVKKFLVLFSSTLVFVLGAFSVSASGAQAYMHADNCKGGLRHANYPGDLGRDDDIHNYGAARGWTFGGFGTAWHPGGASNTVYVNLLFYSGSTPIVRVGICAGSDSSFTDGIVNLG